MVSVFTIATPGLGDRSYVVGDGRAAVVVDPQRDVGRFRAVLDRLGVPLTHVLETHIHNDYVSGGLELARAAGARYVVAGAERVGYDRVGVTDGQELRAGGMRIRVLATPGHTPHHLTYVVDDQLAFTGGSLLYGTVGRTDLVGADRTVELTRAQYRSARRLLDELPGGCAVLPTHGFGSFCSSSAAPSRDDGTIDDERRGNLAVQGGEEAFVTTLLAGLTDYPRYYAHMAPINRAGPPPLDLAAPPTLDAAALRERAAAGGWVVDLRGRRAFAAGHLAGTVNIEQGDALATYLGWVVPWGAPVTLAADHVADLDEAQRALARIGIDRLAGRTSEVPRAASYPVAGFADLAAARADQDRAVVDVRRDDEWDEAHLAGALHVPLPDLTARAHQVPDVEVWVHCRTGFRAAIGASLLARAGRRVVLIDDDFDGAAAAGLSLEASSGAACP